MHQDINNGNLLASKVDEVTWCAGFRHVSIAFQSLQSDGSHMDGWSASAGTFAGMEARCCDRLGDGSCWSGRVVRAAEAGTGAFSAANCLCFFVGRSCRSDGGLP